MIKLLICVLVGAIIGFALFGIANCVVDCLGGEENRN